MISPARRHRERMAARRAATAGPAVIAAPVAPAASGDTPASDAARDPAAAQIRMRFTLDRRRLKDIKSIKAKVEAKREMIPEYAAWIEGWFKALEETGVASEDEIVSTLMVWKIDTGDYAGALELAEPMLAHKLALPERYKRTAATLVTEEIAEAALTALGRGEAFDLGVLQQVEALVADEDMHDEVKAKLFKAIGLEFARQADLEADADEKVVLQTNARQALVRARDLHERIGVKKDIEKLDRALRAATDTGSAG